MNDASPDTPKAPARPGFTERTPLPKRFYKEARAAATEDGRFRIELDGRPVRTPGRNLVAVASQPLAAALAVEWQAQVEVIDPMTMPMTRLANSAIDGVAPAMEEVGAEIVRYAGSDLLCYRVDTPAQLVALHAELWDPLLAWARERFGATFMLSEGVVHVAQPPRTLEALAAALPDDPLRLAALNLMTTLSGSALLAFAVAHGRLSPEEAWRAAHADEEVQEQLWGTDAEAQERRAKRFRDFEAASRAYALI
ncbi:chaperone required for assembly of F1-ATPase [Ancylobacter aquaticus]|uniref:Chaperone required for assembly of F1-ATPase n=1 Tax=Ancylobacter aquaticus TaxID=100 RepID=A0A4V2PJI9_ANCAQ|nr:ATP12 family protein [Ancylobacter aquaticus]TCK28696.1 chaperone required for assembly of F1-ATPase [Ancylobacter aquaticus]